MALKRQYAHIASLHFICGSSVCNDSTTQKRKGSKKWGRPGRIHHMSDIRGMYRRGRALLQTQYWAEPRVWTSSEALKPSKASCFSLLFQHKLKSKRTA